MGREGGLTAASAGCPHRHRASKSQPAARHTSGTRILLWLPQLLQHPHGIPGPFGPIDIILRGYWEESQSQEGAVSVPVMLVHLGEEKAFIRVKRLKKKKKEQEQEQERRSCSSLPPPLPKAGLSGALCLLLGLANFPHSRPTNLLSSLSSLHRPLPASTGEFEYHSATASHCTGNLRGSDAQLFEGGKL